MKRNSFLKTCITGISVIATSFVVVAKSIAAWRADKGFFVAAGRTGMMPV